VLLATVDPGEEVVIFQPFYENYGPDAILCGAKPVFVPLLPGQPLELDRLRAACSARTRAIVVNTPNNPTGRVLSRAELEGIADLCRRYDAWAITDEIYAYPPGDAARHGRPDHHGERRLQDLQRHRLARRHHRRAG
jgi:aminotransferase